MLSMCDSTQSWMVKEKGCNTQWQEKTCKPVSSHHLVFTSKQPHPWLQHQHFTMDCIQCEINDEFLKENINWERVCKLFQDNPALCSEREDWGWYPLHFACDQNVPLWATKILLRIWPEGLTETVTMVNESTGNCSKAYALELVCSASAPDEVIIFLVQTSHQLGCWVYHLPGEILMDMNRDLHLLKKYMIIGNGDSARNICSIPKKRGACITGVPSTSCIIMILTW